MKFSAALPFLALLAACGNTQDTSQTTTIPPGELDVAAAEATCRHGSTPTGRSYVVCENGITKLPVFRSALRGSVDASLEMKQLARRFNIPPEAFTGIQAATYGELVPKGEIAHARRDSTPYDSVVVDGTTFDVYHGGAGDDIGTIFIERK